MLTVTSPTTKDHWLPSGNPIVFSLSTTNTAPRLSYIIDVVVNGSVAAQLKYPVYNNNRMDIDVGKIVNDYLDDTFVNDEILSHTNKLVYPQRETAAVSIYVIEEYWNGSAMVTGDIAQTDKIYVWRAAAEFQDARKIWEYENDFEFDIYTQYNPEHPKFLGPKVEGFDYVNNVEKSNYVGDPNFFRSRYKVSMNTIRTVSFFTYGYIAPIGAITDVIVVWCYDRNFIRTKEFRWNNPDASIYTLSSLKKKVSQFPCAPANLNNVPWSNINLVNGATLNYIDPSEDKYYVIFTHEGYDLYSKQWGIRPIPFEIVCNEYDTYDILYKTREGGWWQIRADRKSFRETTVNTSVKYNTWGIGAHQPVPNSKRFKQTMHTDADGTITVNTDWLNSQYFIEEIEDMIVSPQIYLIKEGTTPVYIPVVLKDSTHKIWNKNQEKLIQYEFEFEEAYKKATLL